MEARTQIHYARQGEITDAIWGRFIPANVDTFSEDHKNSRTEQFRGGESRLYG
jgi:hypothetical protein